MISSKLMQHAKVWAVQDIRGWHFSEKLDGCRGYWDGGALWSRSGRRILVPRDWEHALPRMHLDGEVWAGRGRFLAARDAVLYGRWTSDVVFMIFDAPCARGDWPARMAAVADAVRCGFAHAIPWSTIHTLHEAAATFRGIVAAGGEAMMARRPGIERYISGRTDHVLKNLRDPITGAPVQRPRRRRGSHPVLSRAA